MKPILLLILDGWGIAPKGRGNAVSLADTPVLDSLFAEYPHSRLTCSGRAVGLPDGFMGNSEVGHMNIGAGRVVYQDMTRIDISIEDGSFYENPVLVELMEKTRAGSGRLHLMGLISDGGVHSHQNHLYALLKIAKKYGIEQVYIHVFLDGRDTPPDSGLGYVEKLMQEASGIGVGQVATVSGRFYAMDRDKRWERTELAYDALVLGRGPVVSDPLSGIRASYEAGEMDEFVKPCVVSGLDGRIGDGDGVFFFNFRADRARQISRALFDAEFEGFTAKSRPEMAMMATMTEYEGGSPLAAAFPPVMVIKTLGEVISGLGKKQLRIAETEKYAHVTYFFNCGREEPFPGEDRIMIPSPREVATYDLKPQMSAEEVTENLVSRLPEYDMCVCNLANLDMVGHSGIIKAAIKACETVDKCVGRIVDKVLAVGGHMLLTADHGNAEEMLSPEGRPQTAHSLNKVPLVYIGADSGGIKLGEGVLGDLAPTILDLSGLEQPVEMTGKSLVLKG